MWREAQFETELKKAEDEPLLGNPRLLRRGGHSRFWPGEGEGLQSAIRLKRFPPPSFFDNFPRAAARIFTYRVVEKNRKGEGGTRFGTKNSLVYFGGLHRRLSLERKGDREEGEE